MEIDKTLVLSRCPLKALHDRSETEFRVLRLWDSGLLIRATILQTLFLTSDRSKAVLMVTLLPFSV